MRNIKKIQSNDDISHSCLILVQPSYIIFIHRRLGLGRKLVLAVIQHAVSIGTREVYLTTYKTMYSAVRLYERMGFQIVGEMTPITPYIRRVTIIIGERVLKFTIKVPQGP